MDQNQFFSENVVLVDQFDHEVGVCEKLAAHLDGRLHRAVSVFLFNEKKELLIQQRAFSKYHSGGLWSNACCSHPRPGEAPDKAAHRRLQEEMGIDCPLKKSFTFIYKAFLGQGLTEYEYDHVYIGQYEGNPVINPQEAASFRWIDLDLLKKEILDSPDSFTYWFKVLLPKISV